MLRSLGYVGKGWPRVASIRLGTYSSFNKNRNKPSTPVKTKAEAEADQTSHKEAEKMWKEFLPGEFVDPRTPEQVKQDEIFARPATRLTKERQHRFEQDLTNQKKLTLEALAQLPYELRMEAMKIDLTPFPTSLGSFLPDTPAIPGFENYEEYMEELKAKKKAAERAAARAARKE